MWRWRMGCGDNEAEEWWEEEDGMKGGIRKEGGIKGGVRKEEGIKGGVRKKEGKKRMWW